jgi:hypothetical protein
MKSALLWGTVLSPNIIWVIISRKMGWGGYVSHIGQMSKSGKLDIIRVCTGENQVLASCEHGNEHMGSAKQEISLLNNLWLLKKDSAP